MLLLKDSVLYAFELIIISTCRRILIFAVIERITTTSAVNCSPFRYSHYIMHAGLYIRGLQSGSPNLMKK